VTWQLKLKISSFLFNIDMISLHFVFLQNFETYEHLNGLKKRTTMERVLVASLILIFKLDLISFLQRILQDESKSIASSIEHNAINWLPFLNQNLLRFVTTLLSVSNWINQFKNLATLESIDAYT